MNMNENIITTYDNKNEDKYKILLAIEKENYYIIYTDLKNYNIKEDLYAIKLNSLDSEEVLPISDDEWKMLEYEYNNLVK